MGYTAYVHIGSTFVAKNVQKVINDHFPDFKADIDSDLAYVKEGHTGIVGFNYNGLNDYWMVWQIIFMLGEELQCKIYYDGTDVAFNGYKPLWMKDRHKQRRERIPWVLRWAFRRYWKKEKEIDDRIDKMVDYLRTKINLYISPH